MTYKFKYSDFISEEGINMDNVEELSAKFNPLLDKGIHFTMIFTSKDQEYFTIITEEES